MTNYNDLFPDLSSAQKVYPDRLMGPHNPIYAEPHIMQSWRMSFCTVCKASTTWRYVDPDDPLDATEIRVMAPICGPECMEKFLNPPPTPQETT